MSGDDEIKVRMALVEQNYQNLNNRMIKVEEKLDSLHDDIKSSNTSLIKALVGAAATIIAGAIGVIITILMKF